MDWKGLAAFAVFFAGLAHIAFVASAASPRDALLESLNDANVSYIADAAEDRGARVFVLTTDDDMKSVCDLAAQHPDVGVVRVFNSITGMEATCK